MSSFKNILARRGGWGMGEPKNQALRSRVMEIEWLLWKKACGAQPASRSGFKIQVENVKKWAQITENHETDWKWSLSNNIQLWKSNLKPKKTNTNKVVLAIENPTFFLSLSHVFKFCCFLSSQVSIVILKTKAWIWAFSYEFIRSFNYPLITVLD